MNFVDKTKYIEFISILSGCRTILDGYHFSEKYSKNNPEMKSIISSMINGKRYEQVLDFKTIKSAIEILDNVDYKDDAEEIIGRYAQKTTDVAQIRALKRMAKNKILRPLDKPKSDLTQIKQNEEDQMITKKCPHCETDCKANINTSYIICGCFDSHKGWDWIGCKKDWCFKCGKMLCKSWEPNKLYVEQNRQHDNECCKHHADENKKNYPDDYCQCFNTNVMRDLSSLLF
jgi:hypothetical protein